MNITRAACPYCNGGRVAIGTDDNGRAIYINTREHPAIEGNEWGVRIQHCPMYKHILWAWAIKNSVALICWVAIAIIFGKWWLALFAILFMSGLKSREDA